MPSTEFFKTLAEAEAFQPARILGKEVYGLDKRGTAKKFREWRDDAISFARYAETKDARAVVVIWR